jgi:Tol biopolymer transport system component
VAVSRELWGRGGHHPNWTPDGRRILINLKPEDALRFCTANADGSDFKILCPAILGSGHPAFDPTGRFIFTDCYPQEPVALPDGSVAMRLIDTKRDEEKTVLPLYALGRMKPSVLRLDPHPAWSRDGLKSCFNGAPDGRRQVFIADLSMLLK